MVNKGQACHEQMNLKWLADIIRMDRAIITYERKNILADVTIRIIIIAYA